MVDPKELRDAIEPRELPLAEGAALTTRRALFLMLYRVPPAVMTEDSDTAME
jgi:hypothetical protein